MTGWRCSAVRLNLLEEVRDISTRAIRPGDVRGIRLEAGRHHVQNRSDAVAASSFLRVVVHPETVLEGGEESELLPGVINQFRAVQVGLRTIDRHSSYAISSTSAADQGGHLPQINLFFRTA